MSRKVERKPRVLVKAKIFFGHAMAYIVAGSV